MSETDTIKPTKPSKPTEGIAIRALYFRTTRDLGGTFEQGVSRIFSNVVRPDKPTYRIRLMPGPMYLVQAWKAGKNPEKGAVHDHEFVIGHDEGMTAELEPR